MLFARFYLDIFIQYEVCSHRSCSISSWFLFFVFAAAKSLQSCLILWDPIDGSPPGPAVPGILQARTLEWVAISFSNAWKWKVKVKLLSCVWLFTTPWIAAYQAPPSMGFSRQEYWSGLPLPSPKKKSLERHKIMIHLKVISFMPPRFLRNKAGQIMYLLNQAAFLCRRMVPKSCSVFY